MQNSASARLVYPGLLQQPQKEFTSAPKLGVQFLLSSDFSFELLRILRPHFEGRHILEEARNRNRKGLEIRVKGALWNFAQVHQFVRLGWGCLICIIQKPLGVTCSIRFCSSEKGFRVLRNPAISFSFGRERLVVLFWHGAQATAHTPTPIWQFSKDRLSIQSAGTTVLLHELTTSNCMTTSGNLSNH